MIKQESPLEKFHSKQWVIKPQVPNKLYTDRINHLNHFYKQALLAARERTRSIVLLGQRRMGKTEIFNRVVNRLFWEQDHTDPDAVVPVHYRFLDHPPSLKEFFLDYAENFIRWWSAFRLRDPNVLEDFPLKELKTRLRRKLPKTLSGKIERAFTTMEGLTKGDYPNPGRIAIGLIKTIAEYNRQTIVVFLDEFQNTHLPQQDFQIVGYFQPVVESLSCPHFVTGSAMSILSREIIGAGSLYGRFRSESIENLTRYHGTLLAEKCADYFEVELPETMAPLVTDRCGGNPFYISAVVERSSVLNEPLTDEKKLDEILEVDLSSGFIWAELNDQVNRWIERINDYGITKWVLYLSALGEKEEIDPERIQKEIKEKDFQEVELSKIRDILIKLSRGDLLEYFPFGNWFRKISDPILVEFLKVWGRSEVERQNSTLAKEHYQSSGFALKKRIDDHKGYLAEVYMSQILWNAQKETLPGKFFHQKNDIVVPSRFIDIHQRKRLKSGRNREIDIVAYGGTERWLCESKWWIGKKVGKKEIEKLLENGRLLSKEDKREEMPLVFWFFANDGFTKEAEKYMKTKNVLWSTREDLDALLEYTGLRQLPDL